jgi:hypothetical protein
MFQNKQLTYFNLNNFLVQLFIEDPLLLEIHYYCRSINIGDTSLKDIHLYRRCIIIGYLLNTHLNVVMRLKKKEYYRSLKQKSKTT